MSDVEGGLENIFPKPWKKKRNKNDFTYSVGQRRAR